MWRSPVCGGRGAADPVQAVIAVTAKSEVDMQDVDKHVVRPRLCYFTEIVMRCWRRIAANPKWADLELTFAM
jgi:hypothetical protein